MIFDIFVLLVLAVFLAVLELSKNVLAGWAMAIVIAAVLMVLKRRGTFGKGMRAGLVCFALLFLLFAADYFITAPGYKNTPAVDNKNPDVTEVITIPQGSLTGVYNADHSVKVYAGIPYAKAPVGELRFKEPMPHEGWEGVRAFDHFEAMAMQPRNPVIIDSLTQILGYNSYRIKIGDEYKEPVSEDCLYLNVFSPETGDKELMPVLFYIHGGSLTTGQSSYTEYRGEDLAKEGIVVVNFAYRLGIFGYYASEDLQKESPNGTTGNYGLLDQIAALNWVYDNIEAFGGDKNRITIAGESAGSSSVNALCVSPLTEGKFDYAIAESSGIVARKPFHTFRSFEEAIDEGNKVKEEFGADSSFELRNIPAKKLVKTSTHHNSMTVDGYAIKEMPYLTYEKGENHEKALLNGFNQKESDAFLLDTKATRENYEELLAEELGETYAKKMAQVVPYDLPQRDQHFVVDALGEAKGALNVAYSAMWFSYSHYLWNNYLVDQGIPCYEYYFTKTNDSLSNYHAGELPYAYGNLWRHPGVYDESDYELSDIMKRYFANFVKTGNPNGDGLPEWKMRSKNEERVLELNTNIQMIEDPNMEIYRVIDGYQAQ